MKNQQLNSDTYNKVEKLTKYIGLFFVALGLIFLYDKPESNVTGFRISAAIVVLTVVVAVYNDIRYKQYKRLIDRGISVGLVILLTVAYIIFVA